MKSEAANHKENHEDTSEEEEETDDELSADKRNPYSFGLGKRSMGNEYGFGLGKRNPYAFGLGKRFQQVLVLYINTTFRGNLLYCWSMIY